VKLVLGPEDADGDGPTIGDVRRFMRGVVLEFGAENIAPNQPSAAAAAAAAAAAGGGPGSAAAAAAAGGALTGALPPQAQQQRAAPATSKGRVVAGRYHLGNNNLVHNILRDQVKVIREEKLGWTAREGTAGGLVKGGELTAEGERHMEAIEQRLLSSSSVGWVRSHWPSLAGLGGEGQAAEEARSQLGWWIHSLISRRAESRGTGEWHAWGCIFIWLAFDHRW